MSPHLQSTGWSPCLPAWPSSARKQQFVQCDHQWWHLASVPTAVSSSMSRSHVLGLVPRHSPAEQAPGGTLLTADLQAPTRAPDPWLVLATQKERMEALRVAPLSAPCGWSFL